MPGADDDKRNGPQREGALLPPGYLDDEAFDALGREGAALDDEAFDALGRESAPEPVEAGPPEPAPPITEPAQEPVAAAPETAEAPAPRRPLVNLDDEAFDALGREPLPEDVPAPEALPEKPPAPSVVDEVPYVLPVVRGRVPRIPLEPPEETPARAPEAPEGAAALPSLAGQVAVGDERMKALEDQVAQMRALLEQRAQPEAPPAPAAAFPPGPARPGAGFDWQGAIREGQGRELTRQAELQQEYGGPLGTVAAAGQGLMRGATFGLSDPALAGVAALGRMAVSDESFTDAYGQARAELDKTREANPWTSGLSEVTGAVGPALLTGGTSALASAAARTPAGAVARLGERLASEQAVQAVARGAGPIMAGARGLGAAGAAEGLIGGVVSGTAESLRPGITPGQVAENLAWSAGGGTVLGWLGGSAVGAAAGAARRGARAADELLDPNQFAPRPLPDIEASDVPMSELRATAQAMGGNRNAQTSVDDILANDARPKFARNVDNTRMATGGHEELLQRETKAALKDFKRWFALRKKLDDQAGIAQKKSVSSFDETDARPLYEPGERQGEIDFDAPGYGGISPELPRSQAAKAVLDDVFTRLRTLIDEFVANPEAPPPKGEVRLVSRLAGSLEQTHAQITDDLIDGKIGSAFARYTEDVRARLLTEANKLLESDAGSDRMREFLRTLVRESSSVVDDVNNPHAVELSSRFPRAQEAQRALDNQFARIRAKLDDYVNLVGEDAMSRGDAPTYRIVQRVRQTLDVQQATANRFLGQGKIGDAYGVFDQGVKAAIGKEAQRAKTRDLREFLRELTSEPMNFLEGRNASGTKVASVWDEYVDGRDAIKRVIARIEEIKGQDGAYKGSPKARQAVDRVVNRIKRVTREGDMNGWQSTGYLEDLRKQIKQTANSAAQWDLELPETARTKAELASLLSEDDTWEALSLAERQFIGNKPWSRSISTSDDSEWSQFFSTGPERAPNDWDNLNQADSASVKRLFANVGDAAAMRDEQAYRLNLRDGAADAEARVRAWGGEGMKETAKETVDLSRTLESRLDLMARARADKLEGEKFLAGSPGLEGLAGAATGAMGATLLGGPLGTLGSAAVGGAGGAQLPKWYRAWVRAVSEAQGGNGAMLTNSARKFVTGVRRLSSAASRGADASADHAERTALALGRLVTEKKARDRLAEAQALLSPGSPEAQALLEQAAQLEQVDPETAEEMVALEQRRATAVTESVPGDGSKLDPTSTRRLIRTVTAAYNPENTLKRMVDGVATADEVETLKQVYPQMYEAFTAEVRAQIDVLGPPRNRAGELLLFKVAGIPARATLGQEQLRQQQIIAKSASGEEAQPDRGAVRERVSQTYKMDPDRYTTKSDRIMSE